MGTPTTLKFSYVFCICSRFFGKFSLSCTYITELKREYIKKEYIDNYNNILSNCNVGISILYKHRKLGLLFIFHGLLQRIPISVLVKLWRG